jgi:hypothetical protein
VGVGKKIVRKGVRSKALEGLQVGRLKVEEKKGGRAI